MSHELLQVSKGFTAVKGNSLVNSIKKKFSLFLNKLSKKKKKKQKQMSPSTSFPLPLQPSSNISSGLVCVPHPCGSKIQFCFLNLKVQVNADISRAYRILKKHWQSLMTFSPLRDGLEFLKTYHDKVRLNLSERLNLRLQELQIFLEKEDQSQSSSLSQRTWPLSAFSW